jgi:hypothetical protein
MANNGKTIRAQKGAPLGYVHHKYHTRLKKACQRHTPKLILPGASAMKKKKFYITKVCRERQNKERKREGEESGGKRLGEI